MPSARDRLPWFPCYPERLLGALAGMKPAEGYVYLLVLLRIYDSGGPCSDTLDALATRSRLNKRAVSEALDSLFKAGRLRREADGIHNPVADVVLADAKSLREKRKTAGREGGLSAAEKRKKNQSQWPSKATTSPPAKTGEAKAPPQATPVYVLSSSDSPSLFGKEVDEGRKQEESLSRGWSFDEFYGLYPNKVGKKAARAAFDRIRRSGEVEFADLMDGLRRYRAKSDDRPWCNPATWLNQGRWDDQPVANNGGADGSVGKIHAGGGKIAGAATEALKRFGEAGRG